jgi:hypothetical protein
MRPVHIKEQRQKEVRRIDKEHREIRKKIHGLPLVKLDKPIRHGWYKEIVFTENLDRYKTQEVVEEIFEILNTYFWGRTKKECEKHWDKQRSEYFIYREVPTISKKQFNKLSAKAQLLCTPFQYREDKKLKVRFYVRIPVNAYRVKFTRAYNTHRKLLDPNLESRLAVLQNYLLSPGIYEAEQTTFRSSWKCDWNKRETITSRIKAKQKLGRLNNTSAATAIGQLLEEC